MKIRRSLALTFAAALGAQGAPVAAYPVVISGNVTMFSNPASFLSSARALDGGHKLARSERALHAVYIHNDNNTYTLVYSRSADDGASWQQKNLVTTTNHVFTPISNPSIAVHNNKVYVVYADVYDLKLIIFDDTILNSISSTTIVIDSGKTYYRYADIAIDDSGNIYIAALFDVDRYRVRFFHANSSNLKSWTEEKAPVNKTDSNNFDYFTPPTDYAVPTIAMRVTLAVSPVDQDVVLAFDYAQFDPDDYSYDTLLSNATSRVAMHKYDSSSGFPAVSSPVYINSAQYGNAAYDADGNLHVVYTADPSSNVNTVGYKKYDANLNPISVVFPAITAPKIYSPHIGFTAANIPVIQFVSGNGTTCEILQVSRRAPDVWTTDSLIKNVSSPAEPAMFSHMVADVRDNRPDMLWWNTNNGSSGAVYYNRPSDYVGDAEVSGAIFREHPRNTAEKLRNTAEILRNTAEILRNTAEILRNTAEQLRNTAEIPRNTAEPTGPAACQV
jgi:hypothetical protein